MKFSLCGFKQFILEDMDPSPEKTRDAAMGGSPKDTEKKQDYFNALGDEEGIEWSDLTKILEDEPWGQCGD